MKTIALPVGDPNGIGPEIVLKALEALKGEDRLRITVFGPADVMLRAAKSLRLESLLYGVELRNVGELSVSAAKPGEVNAKAGASAVASATAAIKACQAGEFDAVVAGPHNETAVHQAGITFSGYPSLVARVCGQPEDTVFLMLVGGGLRIVHVTLHESVASAIARITPERVVAAASSACPVRASRCSASIRMRPRAVCSGTKTSSASHRRPSACAIWAWTSPVRKAPTCCWPIASTTCTSRCCTTRATSR
jgi:1,2-dihydroxy-3,5-cyclohexadiene-1,4-dicarboxylate dehydrogenase